MHKNKGGDERDSDQTRSADRLDRWTADVPQDTHLK